MKITTKNLLTRLEAIRGGSYRVREEDLPGDSDFIYLQDNYVLSIEEDAALPTVSLVELMDIGGNVEIDSWVITEDAVIDEAVAAAIKSSCSKCYPLADYKHDRVTVYVVSQLFKRVFKVLYAIVSLVQCFRFRSQ